MPKIAIIGAGTMQFVRALVADITTYPELAGAEVCLMDISPERLDMSKRLADRIILQQQSNVKITTTTDRVEALKGAQYVMITFQIGGLAAVEDDIRIPEKYGVSQCVGDTMGPGGIFRGLRTVPVLIDVARDMEKYCPDAILLQYCNPMAINMWALQEAVPGLKMAGLCHSIPGASRMMASWIGAPYEEITFTAAGINHMAWFLEFKWNGQDAYPLLWKAMEDPANYAKEPVRIDMARHVGYFMTESSGHLSEYLPWFRNSERHIDELVAKFTDPGADWLDWGRTGGYLKFCHRELETAPARRLRWINGEVPVPVERSVEYGPAIVAAVEANQPLVFYGNVLNTGLIDNLAPGSCVEVPVVVDRHGFRPTHVGKLPPHLAALNTTNIIVQELTARGSQTGDRDLIRNAIALDPVTSSVLSLSEIDAMTNEMFAANERWLPQFKK
jgi:alpha-galactosidase